MPNHTARLLVISSLAAVCFACASTPDEPDETNGARGIEADRSDWSNERRQLDDRVEDFLTAPDHFSVDDTRGLTRAVQRKAETQQALEQQLQTAYEDAEGREAIEPMGWSRFRLAQTYLNFGCRIGELPIPDDLTAQQQTQYELAVAELTQPMFGQAHQIFSEAEQLGASPWDELAGYLVGQLHDIAQSDGTGDAELVRAVDETCTATVEYWRPIGVEYDAATRPADAEGESDRNDTSPDRADSDTPATEVAYTCPMHPEIHEDEPGSCPTCQMDLVAEESSRDILIGRGEVTPEDATTVTVELDEPDVDGDCDPEAIDEVTTAQRPALASCYATERSDDPDLEGEVRLNWRVEADGYVSSAELVDSDLDNEEVEECLRLSVQLFAFEPSDGDGCDVEMSMTFSAPDQQQ